MDFEMILMEAHSGVRWLAVLISVIALVWMARGWMQSRIFDKTSQRIMSAFSGIITLQWVLGLILFFVLNSFSVGYRWEHALTLTIATGVSHMHMRWKGAQGVVRYRNSLFVIVAVLVLVFIGVARLPGGEGALGGWMR